MIPIPSGVWVLLASGNTDMRRMNFLALQVQQWLGCNPHLCAGCDYVAVPTRRG
ncbi:MAG TPA: hypothetical protein VMT20_22140 [Terriglobia bacterium]|nr:hypothetical protein [Terriglobia bacterium]